MQLQKDADLLEYEWLRRYAVHIRHWLQETPPRTSSRHSISTSCRIACSNSEERRLAFQFDDRVDM